MTPAAPRALISVLLACVVSIGALTVGAGASAAATKKQPTDVSVQVIGGYAANRATTPWFLQLALDDPGGGTLCGATAIAPRWAVTAAHCVVSTVSRIRIGPGKTAIFVNPALRSHGTRYYIQRAIVHPGFRVGAVRTFHDVALLQTYLPMPVTPLPLNGARALPGVDAPLKVFGFGIRESNNYATLPGRLQEANVLDLGGPKNACGLYGSTYNPALQLCSGLVEGGVDSCQGDSGGPLTAVIGGRTRLVGIVSSGADCALPDYPGIYTRISTYVPWIRYHTSGQIYTESTCTAPGCALNRGQSAVVRLTNVTPAAGSYRIVGGEGVTALTRRSGVLMGGQRNGIVLTATTAQPRCINLLVTATRTPVRRIIISANGQSGCK